MPPDRSKRIVAIALALVAAGALAAIAPAAMHSKKIDRNLCKTSGGGSS